MPKVSVIIPVYGVEQYIERCARSLFEQTLDDIEYLFIDDCTPDKSVEVLKSVLEDYPNRKNQVIIHRMEQNSGQAAVRKWGMQNATGEYVIHCDSDDWVDSDMYRAMYEKAVEEGSDVVICDYEIVTSKSQEHTKAVLGEAKVDAIISDILKVKTSSSLWNKLFRICLIDNELHYPTNNMGEDLAICIQLLGRAHLISYLPTCYYFYFYNNVSIVNNKAKIFSNFTDIVENVKITIDYCSSAMKGKFKYEFVALQSKKRDIIIPIIFEKDNYETWKNTFKEINRDILICPYLSLKEKMRFLLLHTKLFKMLYR